jgi:hypothetical protein
MDRQLKFDIFPEAFPNYGIRLEILDPDVKVMVMPAV